MTGLDERGVWFVTRQKRNMKMEVVKRLMEPVAATDEKKTQILADEIVVPAKKSTASKYGGTLRRVTAVVRGTLWNRRKLIETLRLYGTAGPVKSHAAKPRPLYFQAVLDFPSAAMGQQTC